MKQYNVTIVRVRRNTGPIGGPFVCERGSWQKDTLRGKRDRFRVIETVKIGTEAECLEAARGSKEYGIPSEVVAPGPSMGRLQCDSQPEGREMKAGDLVLAWDSPGVWREAYLERHEPYISRHHIADGWRIRWKELPKAPAYDPWYMPSHGWWMPVHYLKAIE